MKKKYYKWALVILWMIIIFLFSNKPAVQSDKQSKLVIEVLNTIGINLNSTFGQFSNFIVRKCAHFSEYFIFYILVYNALSEHIKYRKALLYSLIVVFLYASSDEFHQLFVLGRAGRIRDVFIDTSGGCVAASIFYLIKKRSIRLGKKQKTILE